MEAALKTEFVTDDSDQTLRNEVHMLRIMQWSKSYCKLYSARRLDWGGQKVNIMVMSLCDRPISRLRRMMPKRKFTKSTAARLSYQFLEAIRDIHMCGILHRDVKASNCGWHEPSRRLLLFDLGFCRKYLERDPQTKKLRLRTARKSAGFLGTSKYCSVFVHDEMDQGRRDDLWAWLYAISEFFLGDLPWSNEDNTHLVSRRKHKIGSSIFLKCPREILPMYDHIRQLKFESRPDYEMMFKKFAQMFARLEIDEFDLYDFEQGSPYYEKCYRDRKTDSETEMTSEGVETKLSRVVDVDEAPDLLSCGSLVTLNTTKSESSVGLGTRLATGLNRAFKKVWNFRKNSKKGNKARKS
ncbi:unnamed protein product [Caenorhabditis bovis]|uniref:Protein kinase domain-containing protein n=1 Tax=Caenorhabditis bovis TaxID=2654633 RepID=A0A8S1F4H4_9PELO|nr:unnamed protein product [Caenorhabditis bovis]